jgi:hypothetical protein
MPGYWFIMLLCALMVLPFIVDGTFDILGYWK